MKKYLIGIFGLILVGAIIWLRIFSKSSPNPQISSFTECAAHGFPVMMSYPRICRAGMQTFIELVVPVPAPGDSTSGIRGVAMLGPTCPVQRFPDDGTCADKPYVTMMRILKLNGDLVASFSTKADGTFEVPLVPGQYVIDPMKPGTMLPRASEETVTVEQGKFIEVKIDFDSGIR